MPTAIFRDEGRELLEGGAQLVEVLPRKEEYEEEHLPGAITTPESSVDRVRDLTGTRFARLAVRVGHRLRPSGQGALRLHARVPGWRRTCGQIHGSPNPGPDKREPESSRHPRAQLV